MCIKGILTPVMFSHQLSARETSLARRTRCVSDQTSAAAVMDILERAVTPVRDHFVLRLPSYATFSAFLANGWHRCSP